MKFEKLPTFKATLNVRYRLKIIGLPGQANPGVNWREAAPSATGRHVPWCEKGCDDEHEAWAIKVEVVGSKEHQPGTRLNWWAQVPEWSQITQCDWLDLGVVLDVEREKKGKEKAKWIIEPALGELPSPVAAPASAPALPSGMPPAAVKSVEAQAAAARAAALAPPPLPQDKTGPEASEAVAARVRMVASIAAGLRALEVPKEMVMPLAVTVYEDARKSGLLATARLTTAPTRAGVGFDRHADDRLEEESGQQDSRPDDDLPF